jgi:ferredoxin-NADP reductase
MASLFRNPRALIILGTSAFGGAAFRAYSKPTSSSEASLNPHTFTAYTLVDKQSVSSTSAIFTLRNRDGAPDPESVRESWKRSVWSVQVKQPQLQIARAYTPLPPTSHTPGTDDQHADDIRLLIRQEASGEVSTYLHRLPEQSTVELRGPNIECELPHDIKEVLFLAGGTGIAPAMQVAQAMGRRTGSKMQILWANRKREECLGGVSDETDMKHLVQSRLGWWKSLFGFGQSAGQETLFDNHGNQSKGVIVKELDALKERNSTQTRGLTVQYYCDEENSYIKPGDVAKRLHSRTPEEKGSRVILVSGPDGFIEYWAGKKLWEGGREVQGPLGGVLGRMDLKDWTVFKL